MLIQICVSGWIHSPPVLQVDFIEPGLDFCMNMNSYSYMKINSIPHPPQQRRSQETLERILAATEGLLRSHLFEEVSIQQIASAAKVSVGTIYTRFRTKDDLLPVLLARHEVGVEGILSSLQNRLEAESDFRLRITLVVDFAVNYHVRQRGLLRALTTYVRAKPDCIPTEVFHGRMQQYERVARAVAGVGDRGDVEFALGVINSVCREQILFSEVTPLRERNLSRKSLQKRLTNLVCRGVLGPIHGYQ